jgi:hypothetical protein
MSKWYLYENEEVQGPFEKPDLRGRINPESLVCRAGEEEWNPAESVPELEDLFTEPPTPEPSTTDSDSNAGATTEDSVEPIEPTLENLREICEKASDRNLRYEYDHHSEEYDSEELEVIRSELERRSLLNEA